MRSLGSVVPNVNRAKGVNGVDKVDPPTSTFTELLNWVATVKFTTAALSHTYIQNDLTSKRYTIPEEDIKKKETWKRGRYEYSLRPMVWKFSDITCPA